MKEVIVMNSINELWQESKELTDAYNAWVEDDNEDKEAFPLSSYFRDARLNFRNRVNSKW